MGPEISRRPFGGLRHFASSSSMRTEPSGNQSTTLRGDCDTEPHDPSESFDPPTGNRRRPFGEFRHPRCRIPWPRKIQKIKVQGLLSCLRRRARLSNLRSGIDSRQTVEARDDSRRISTGLHLFVVGPCLPGMKRLKEAASAFSKLTRGGSPAEAGTEAGRIF